MESVSPNRWKFLLQSLSDLDNSLSQLGSRLFVLEGRPVDLLPSLFKRWNITRLSFETDSEPHGKLRDTVITNIATQAGVEVISRVSHTLYDVDDVLLSTGGVAPQLFEDFEDLIAQRGRPGMPAPRINKKLFGSCVTPVGKDHNEQYGIPKLENIVGKKAIITCPALYHGGEQEAIVRLEAALQEVRIAFLNHLRSLEVQ